VSNVTGEVATDKQLGSPDYWAEHLRRGVRFADGVRTMRDRGVTTYLELSPAPALLPHVPATLAASGGPEPVVVAALGGERPETEAIGAMLGRLFTAGVRPDLGAVLPPGTRPAELPTYPFRHKRY